MLSLYQLTSLPTLAETKYAWFSDCAQLQLQINPVPDPKTGFFNLRTFLSRQKYEQLKQEYNNRFGEQPDYILWRLIYFSEDITLEQECYKKKWQLAKSGLDSKQTIFWNIISLIPKLISINLWKQDEDFWQFILACKNKLLQNPPALPGAKFGCELIKILAFAKLERAIFKKYGSPTLHELKASVQWVENNLKKIDPNWRLGRALSHKKIKNEERNRCGRSVLLIRHSEATIQEATIFHSYGNRIRSTIYLQKAIIDKESQDLLHKATLFAYTYWRQSRSARRSEEHQEKSKPTWKRRKWAMPINTREAWALYELVEALQAEGKFLASAVFAHHFLRLLPNELIQSYGLKSVLRSLTRIVGRAGLEVDSRFHDRHERKQTVLLEEFNASNSNFQLTEPILPLESEIPAAYNLETEVDEPDLLLKKPSKVNIPMLRLRQDFELDIGWQKLQQKYLHKDLFDYQHIHKVFTAISMRLNDSNFIEDYHLFYSLILKYEQINLASKLLSKFQPNSDEIIHFAQAMIFAHTALPFGMNIRQHQKWQTRFKQTLNRSSSNIQFTTSQIFLIHEVLLGRVLSILRYSDNNALFEKYYGLLSEDEIRSTLDNDVTSLDSGPDGIDISYAPHFLKKCSSPSLGSPVYVSVVSFGEDTWSIIVTTSNGKTSHAYLSAPKLIEQVNSIYQTYSDWTLRNQKSITLKFPWGQDLTRLCQVIHQLVKQVQPDCRWIILAIEPELVSLPWQNLVSRLIGPDILVSYIPSLSWAKTSIEDLDLPNNGDNTFNTEFLSSSLELDGLRQQIIRDKINYKNIKQSFKDNDLRIERNGNYTANTLAVVMGHGTKINGDLPSVAANPNESSLMNTEDWINLADYKTLIVHSCHSGSVNRAFLGDLGGLPGLTLSFKCQVFCSPIAEVPIETAMTFQKHLFKSTDREEIGARYLDALKEDPMIALYSIYGLANTKI